MRSSDTPEQEEVNRTVKADRAAVVAAMPAQARTISIRLERLPNTSIVVRLPAAREARSTGPALFIKSGERAAAVACEPMVSVLTEVECQDEIEVAEPEFAASDETYSDRPRAGDNDRAVGTAMGAKAGRKAVADEASGREGMRNLLQRCFRATAPESGQGYSRVHQRKILPIHSGLFDRCRAGSHDRAP